MLVEMLWYTLTRMEALRVASREGWPPCERPRAGSLPGGPACGAAAVPDPASRAARTGQDVLSVRRLRPLSSRAVTSGIHDSEVYSDPMNYRIADPGSISPARRVEVVPRVGSAAGRHRRCAPGPCAAATARSQAAEQYALPSPAVY